MTCRLRSHSSGACRLVFGCAALLFVWLVILPRIGRIEPVSEMIKHHRELGIDPSIMFYTEIEHLEYRHGILRHKASLVDSIGHAGVD